MIRSCGQVAVLMAGVASLCGCVSFPEHRLATASALAAPSTAPLPSASLEVNLFTGTPSGNPVALDAGQPGVEALQAIVRQSIAQSGIFREVRAVGDKGKADLHLNVRIYESCNTAEAVVATLVTGLTLGLVPGGTTETYSLRMEVTDNRGQTLARVANQDAARDYVGLLMLPLARSHSADSGMRQVIANQVQLALIQAYNAGKLVAMNTADHGGAEQP